MAIDCLESPVFIFIDWKIEFYDTIVQRFLNHLVIALLSFTRDDTRSGGNGEHKLHLPQRFFET